MSFQLGWSGGARGVREATVGIPRLVLGVRPGAGERMGFRGDLRGESARCFGGFPSKARSPKSQPRVSHGCLFDLRPAGGTLGDVSKPTADIPRLVVERTPRGEEEKRIPFWKCWENLSFALGGFPQKPGVQTSTAKFPRLIVVHPVCTSVTQLCATGLTVNSYGGCTGLCTT